jgi:hypothetical protein
LYFKFQQGNRVHATIWDNNISAFENELTLGKTYLISNAYVRHPKNDYRLCTGDVQWTISGTTRVEEIQENNDSLLFSTFHITPFEDFEKYMDMDTDIGIVIVFFTCFSSIFLFFSKLFHTNMLLYCSCTCNCY